MRHLDLLAADVIFVAVDDRPQSAALAGKPGREHAVLQSGCVRFPVGADQQIRELALDIGDSPQGFGIPWSDLVPDAPDVLPALVAHAVEERGLQIVGLVACPTIADVDHVAGFQPLQLADHGRERILPIAPTLVVPHQLFVGARRPFGFERHRMAGLVGCRAVSAGHPVEGIAVHAIRANFGHKLGGRDPIWLAHVARAGVPRHAREEDPHTAAMEILDHLAQGWDPARQIASQVPLIAVVDSYIRINRPDQHAIHTAVALVDIAQVAIDRILSGGRIVEIALLGHHLRLNKIALRPEEFGAPVFDIVVAHADEALAPPLAQVAEPGLVFAASGDLPLAQFRYPIGNGSPAGTRYLTPIRRIPRILCHYAQGCREENADDASHHRRTYHGGAAGD